MKVVIFALAFLTAAVLADQDQQKNAIEIVESTYENGGDGNYEFKYKGSDGSARQEHGELRSLTGEDMKPAEVVVVTGEYSWTSPEGQLFTLKFLSDEKGFRAIGDHLPK